MSALKWVPPDYPGGRILAVSGTVHVGAVLHPLRTGRWRWRAFVGGPCTTVFDYGTGGEAKTELAAKNALAAAWDDFLTKAGVKI